MMLLKRTTTTINSSLLFSNKRSTLSMGYNCLIDQGNHVLFGTTTISRSSSTTIISKTSTKIRMNTFITTRTTSNTRKRTTPSVNMRQQQQQQYNLSTVHSFDQSFKLNRSPRKSCTSKLFLSRMSLSSSSSVESSKDALSSSSSPSDITTPITPMTDVVVERPTYDQLKLLFLHSAIPMIGFGIVDQTIMLHAGNVIDCTIGVLFGLSTLTAAAFGQLCSDSCGVLFGSTLESIFVYAGLRPVGLTEIQRHLPIVHRIKLIGSFLGIILGCTIGLLNLLFIDTERSTELKKLEALHGDIDNDDHNEDHISSSKIDGNNNVNVDNIQNNNDNNKIVSKRINTRGTSRGEYHQLFIEGSNDDIETKHATMITVRGPPFSSNNTPIDGLLSTVTNALYNQNCSIVEIHASPSIYYASNNNNNNNMVRGSFSGTFYVIKRDTKIPFTDDELMDLVNRLTIETTPSSVLMNEPATTKELRKLVRRYSVAVHHPDK